MNILSLLRKLFSEKISTAPVVMITKSSDIREFSCIEEAIKELEADSEVSKEKIEKLRLSIEVLKNKGKIKIQNGEIVD